mgnify:FL=1
MKLEHIGIAVENLEEAELLFEKLLGVASYKRENVESEGVTTSFFDCGNVKIELLAAANENSPIAKFVSKKGPGLHHLAFESKDIKSDLKDLKEKGFRLIHEEAKDGADNKKISFIHPKSTMGVLTEFCQDKLK